MNIQIEVGSKVKVGLTIIGLIGLGVLTYIGTKKIKAHNEKLRIKREAEEAERKKKKEEFDCVLSEWKRLHDEASISKITLQNEKLIPESRSYIYMKLSSLRKKILICTLFDYESGYFTDLTDKFIDLSLALEHEDEKALSARIDAMKNEDEHLEKIHLENMAKLEEERKMKHELDILKEKHNSELEMYKAKAETEKAKMNSLAKALKSSDNKSLNTSFNIKTNINED